MSHSKSVYERQLGRANKTSPSRGQGDFTGQTGEPGAGEDAGLGEQEFGTDQNPTAPQDNSQPQYRGGYSMIPPNESRRSQLQRMANKELEELKQWKEAHRPGPINMTPAQLGGCVSETDARWQQQISLRGSKLRQRAKKEEHDRKRKEAENLEYQKMKEIQREKANKLEEKRRQEEEQRKSQLQKTHYQANQQFFQRIEADRFYSQSLPPPNNPGPTTSWAKSHTYRETQRQAEQQKLQQLKEEQRMKSDLLAEKESQMEAARQKCLQEEHRRKNNAFLDNLERRQRSSENFHRFAPPLSNESVEHDTKQHVAASTFYEDLEKGKQHSARAVIGDAACSGTPEGTDKEWDLMKLKCSFPDCESAVLEDLLRQCDGDYETLIQLLQ